MTNAISPIRHLTDFTATGGDMETIITTPRSQTRVISAFERVQKELRASPEEFRALVAGRMPSPSPSPRLTSPTPLATKRTLEELDTTEAHK